MTFAARLVSCTTYSVSEGKVPGADTVKEAIYNPFAARTAPHSAGDLEEFLRNPSVPRATERYFDGLRTLRSRAKGRSRSQRNEFEHARCYSFS